MPTKHSTSLGRKKPPLRFPKDAAELAKAWERSSKMNGKFYLDAVVDTPLGTMSVSVEGGQNIVVAVHHTSLKPEHFGLPVTRFLLRSFNEKDTKNWGEEVRRFLGSKNPS